MKKIYCCGPHGNVGWVRSWTFDEFDSRRITDVELSLDPKDAKTFSLASNDADSLSNVIAYLLVKSDSFGDVTVFNAGEEQ